MEMEDPTGMMLMASGDKPTEQDVVASIHIEKADDGGVVVRVSKRPAGPSGGELPFAGGDDVNAFGSWSEAAEFVSGLMSADASPVEGAMEDEPLLEESVAPEPIEELAASIPPPIKGGVEFAGQRSYRS